MAKKILIVDDQKEIREMASYMIKSLGYETLEAESGEKGLEMAITENPDLIITDHNMGGMNGLQLTRRLKLAELTGNIPVISATSNIDDEYINAYMEAGAYAFLGKPYDLDKLEKTLKQALGGN